MMLGSGRPERTGAGATETGTETETRACAATTHDDHDARIGLQWAGEAS
jgi:hypothetical protein